MINEVFKGVFKIDNRIATLNIAPGKKVYYETLVSIEGNEYRLWNPYRSKLVAAIIRGMKTMRIEPGSRVLYLGAATGTTSSHVSDIVGSEGTVYCIEISETSMRKLLSVCAERKNMLPIMCDALDVDKYAEDVGTADVIYQDVSSRDQAEILLRNSALLKKGGYAYVAIKSQSISVAKNPKEVFDEFLDKISGVFEVLEKIDIAPYSNMHLFVVLRKKG